MNLNVIIPTLEYEHSKKCFESLEHIPFNYNLIKVTEKTNGNWSKAINLGLMQCRNNQDDILIMDDDVVLLENTFTDFFRYYERADIFGFKLLAGNNKIQHAGAFFDNGIIGHNGYGEDENTWNEPLYVVHCTASLLYIKRNVFNKLGFMKEYSGINSEDVDFSYRAIDNNFKILYLPFKAYHYESLTKRTDPLFREKLQTSLNEFTQKFYSGDYPFLIEKLGAIGRGIKL